MSESKSGSVSVLIVGGGPSGLVMAIELTRRGIACRVVDTARSATDKSKAIGVQARTLELFENIGIADDFVSAGNKVVGARFSHDDHELAHLSFAEVDSFYQYILMLPQHETERILIAHLQKLGVSVEREVRMTGFTQDDNKVTASLLHQETREETVETSWIIGCDGAHSTVRHVLNVPFKGEEYAEGFQLADVKIEWSLQSDELYGFLHSGWVLAAFPLPHGRWRLIADVPPDQAPTDRSPTLAEWQTIMDERCPVKSVVSDPLWMANYRIHRRLVSHLHEGRAFLVGDAAHIHSPVGAQGMNTGIQDAVNLAWKIAMVVQGKAGDSLLLSYHLERYPVERGVMVSSDLPLKAIGLHNPLAQAMRDKLISLVSGMGAFQHEVGAKIAELSVQYRHSPIVEQHALHSGPHAGDRAPDGLAAESDGTSIRLLERFSGPGHKLLLFSGVPSTDHTEEIHAAAQILLQRLGDDLTLIFVSDGSVDDPPDATALITDPDGSLHTRYGANHGAAYLVRPDGYIGFRSPIKDLAVRLQTYLDSVLCKRR